MREDKPESESKRNFLKLAGRVATATTALVMPKTLLAQTPVSTGPKEINTSPILADRFENEMRQIVGNKEMPAMQIRGLRAIHKGILEDEKTFTKNARIFHAVLRPYLHPYLMQIFSWGQFRHKNFATNIDLPENSDKLMDLVYQVDGELESFSEFAGDENQLIRARVATMVARNILINENNPETYELQSGESLTLMIRSQLGLIKEIKKSIKNVLMINPESSIVVAGGIFEKNNRNNFFFPDFLRDAFKKLTGNKKDSLAIVEETPEGMNPDIMKEALALSIKNAPPGPTLFQFSHNVEKIEIPNTNPKQYTSGILLTTAERYHALPPEERYEHFLTCEELVQMFMDRYKENPVLALLDRDAGVKIGFSVCDATWVKHFYKAWNKEKNKLNKKVPPILIPNPPTIFAEAEEGTKALVQSSPETFDRMHSRFVSQIFEQKTFGNFIRPEVLKIIEEYSKPVIYTFYGDKIWQIM